MYVRVLQAKIFSLHFLLVVPDYERFTVADPGFPVGGGGAKPLGGRRPLTWVLFGENICENERIGSCWGGARRRRPPGSGDAFIIKKVRGVKSN